MSAHLTDDELIDRMYGLDDVTAQAAHESHLLQCAECAHKLRLFTERRSAALSLHTDLAPVSTAFLAAQRNQILERVEHRPLLGEMGRFRWPWVPAVLAGGLAAAVVLVPHMVHDATPAKAPEKVVQQQEVGTDQLFLEVFSQELAEEPRAASPIRGLFESAPGEQQQ